MKIVITTLIWKRPEIFKIWAIAICRMVNDFPSVDFNVLVAGSEGNVSKQLVEFYGFDYLETPNEPIGNKANLRLQACRKYNADYVLFLGSDDVMSSKTFEFIYTKMQIGYDEIAPMDLYIYDTVSNTLVYSCGYTNKRKGERLAIGRALKCGVLDLVGWNMWKPGINKSLDGSSRDKLKNYIKNPHYYWLKLNGLMIIDIKSPENLSPFAIRENHTVISGAELIAIEEHNLISKL